MALHGGLNDSGDGMLSEINMTPLVDVMLVLLIIFMLTVPVLTQAVSLDLPKASAAPGTARPDTVTLSIDKAGQVFWNSLPVDATTLATRLNTLAQKQANADVQLRADRHTEYQHVMAVMAAAQKNGVDHISFITQPEAAERN
jgi:biopolymer transport protein ExbD